jgi:hypothetical protein
MSKKPFNMGTVWGRIIETKDIQDDKRHLSLHIGCMGKSGNVHVYGTMWNDDKISSLLTQHKKDPNQMFRFRGFFSQYLPTNKTQRLTNFRFYQWDVAPGHEPRAAFIMRGEIVSTEEKGDKGVVNLLLLHPAQSGYKETKEDFELWVPEERLLGSLITGRFYEVKGLLQQGDGEDFYGQAKGDVRPYILSVEEV